MHVYPVPPRAASSITDEGEVPGDGPLKAGSLDGTLIRVPDTPANRAMFGSVGTSDGSSPFP
ncbi:MAG TPA: hypothetical protein VF223_09010 [Trebonia sp.]